MVSRAAGFSRPVDPQEERVIDAPASMAVDPLLLKHRLGTPDHLSWNDIVQQIVFEVRCGPDAYPTIEKRVARH
ncbi:hypothetical protein [Rhizobium sp. PP-F2F-G48]|uniref:hypothetical protein n=1 Tax=Rhizobium sp. PP-F2F-G48 TaxID=2135651 RepID=UPI001044E9A1|nr:hypothetical protein [Rhizobium sp. PP-F2F-G48]